MQLRETWDCQKIAVLVWCYHFLASGLGKPFPSQTFVSLAGNENNNGCPNPQGGSQSSPPKYCKNALEKSTWSLPEYKCDYALREPSLNINASIVELLLHGNNWVDSQKCVIAMWRWIFHINPSTNLVGLPSKCGHNLTTSPSLVWATRITAVGFF